MKISKSILLQAQDDQVLSPGQANALWSYLEQHCERANAFSVANMLYYLGGMMAILAMSLFMAAGYEVFEERGIMVLAFCYGLLAFWLAERAKGKGQSALCGIYAVLTIVQVPLFVFGLISPSGVDYQSYHLTVNEQWLILEMSTLIAAGAALYRFKLPFLLMPVAVTLWYMSMDIAPALFSISYDWEFRCTVSAIWGLFILTFAFYVDLRNKQQADFAFWIYLSGSLSFSLGSAFLSFAFDGVAELIAIGVVVVLHVLLMFAGIVLVRRQLVAFGSLGVFACLSYLAFDVFENSDWWWLALTIAGFTVVYIGHLWQRHENAISLYCQRKTPELVRRLVERRQSAMAAN